LKQDKIKEEEEGKSLPLPIILSIIFFTIWTPLSPLSPLSPTIILPREGGGGKG